MFEDSLNPEEIFRKISAYTGKRLSSDIPVVFDEIQKCEKAITSLKYFCEADDNYRIICAGSLLGVKLNRFQSSFPVGKVRITQLYPMDFEEFLLAAGEELLLSEIKTAYQRIQTLPEALHSKSLRLYHDYQFVGGMPQCVNDYVNNGCDPMRFDRQLQHYIILAYAADMTKYTLSAAEGAKISAAYDSVPKQLAHENPKFKYKEIRPNANRRDFYQPLDWLLSSGMIYKVTKADLAQSPLKAYTDDGNFKIYLSDTGLLSYVSGIKYNDLLPSSNNIFKGALAENFVVQTLAAGGMPLYYYKPDAGMEIDLLIEGEKDIIPVEIKSGRHKRSVSLKNYREKFNPEMAIRFSENNFGSDEGLISLPLYAAFNLV